VTDHDNDRSWRDSGAARVMALGGILFAILLVVNVVATADGPDPVEPAAREAARIATHATAIRWSGLLGLLGDVAFAAFGVGAAVVLQRKGSDLMAALTAAGAVTTAALWSCSDAALVASAQAAQAGLSADVTMIMGHLHSTTLIAGFAPAGATVLLASMAGLFGRATRATGTLVGTAGLLSSTALLSPSLDRGPMGIAVVIVFLGLPLWLVLVAAPLLLSRSAREKMNVSARPMDSSMPPKGGNDLGHR
jgi:hypothetical protein